MTARSIHGLRTLLLCTAALALTAASSGCAPKYKDLSVFLQDRRTDVAGTAYRLAPPDTIRIESPTCNEVQGETQRLRSDGKISLRLIGEVQANGLTPAELAAKLESLLSRYYQEPKVTVRVASYESKNIYAFGEVGIPGPQPFTGRDTLLDVISNVGLNSLAWGSKVKVIRPSANPEERHEVVVNVDKMLESGDLTNNFLLQEGDIVYVPPTPLAWVGVRVQELLYPVTPALRAYNSPLSARNMTDSYVGPEGGQSSRRQLLWSK